LGSFAAIGFLRREFPRLPPGRETARDDRFSGLSERRPSCGIAGIARP
jgi:hypothetical protein